MSLNNGISIIAVPDKRTEVNKHDSSAENVKKSPASFEEAISAAGFGKFQYLLLLAIIPVSWATSIDTSNVAIILPSAECDLQMSMLQKGILNAAHFVGMVSSGFLWGYISDVRGRRTVFLYGYIADGICNVLSGFSQNFWTLAFFKFSSGFIISGPHASIVTYCSEFYGIKGRAKIPLIIGFSIALGNIVAAALAWMIVPQDWSIVLWDGAFIYNSWRIFLSVCGAPTLFGVVCLSLFPESPKFLLSRGRTQDALKVFQQIYRVNTGKPCEQYPIHDLEDESCNKETTDRLENGKSQKNAIFFYPHLPRLLLVTTIQFGTMLAANTIRLWQPQLFTILDNFYVADSNVTVGHELSFCEILDISANGASAATVENSTCVNTVVTESVYINTVIVTGVGSLLLLLASVLQSILSHKKLLLIFYGVALFCILAMNWSTSVIVTVILTCLSIGLTNTSLNTILGVTVILFPTSLRTMAISLVMSAGRTGTTIGNILFPLLLVYGCLAPMLALAVFVLIAIVLTCFLPLSKKTEQ